MIPFVNPTTELTFVDEATYIMVKTNRDRVVAVFNVPQHMLDQRTDECVTLGWGEQAVDMAYRSIGNDLLRRFGFVIGDDWRLIRQKLDNRPGVL